MGSAAVATYEDVRMDFPISVLMAAQPRHPGKLIRKRLTPVNCGIMPDWCKNTQSKEQDEED